MNEAFEDDEGWPWYWKLLIFLLFAGPICMIAIPNFIGGGPDKFTHILNNLRQIDAAKNEWAREHSITNADQIAQFAQPLVAKDIWPFQRGIFDSNGVARPVLGEIYAINNLGRPPEAKLTTKLKFGNELLPKGTTIRLSPTDFQFEIIPPSQQTNN